MFSWCPNYQKIGCHQILVFAWFVAKILVANAVSPTSHADSYQIIGEVRVEDCFLGQIIGKPILSNIWHGYMGHEPNIL